jgi:Xaa-Pro aminopeptidase
MAEGLKKLGLMQGDMQEAVQLGAHALFFPHGLGHMIGLDVHDMEDLGEQHVGYDETVQRSTLFGTAYLRLARQLQPGFVLTVEPGLYFIPQLIDQWKRKKMFEQFINYPALKKYRDFGGIRIEDNVLITKDGHRVLGDPIPKTVEAVEALRS